jgi:3-hydroxyisobutyrate dehydrogenase
VLNELFNDDPLMNDRSQALQHFGDIGLIGIGRMGAAIGARLLDVDASLVVWNRSMDKTLPLVASGAKPAASPADVVSRCTTVIVIMRDDVAMSEVYEGAAGLLSQPLGGRTILDMTTTTAAVIRKFAGAVQHVGGKFLDVPLSGTVTPARAGNLVIMAGGKAEDLEQVRPLLEKLSRKLIHAGPVGTGIAMKLVLNLPLAVYWQSLGEALALGQAHGLDLASMLSLIVDSKAAVGALQAKIPFILGETDKVEFDLAGAYKDLLAMRQTAQDVGLVLPASSVAADSAGAAVAAGWGARDLAQFVRFVAK